MSADLDTIAPDAIGAPGADDVPEAEDVVDAEAVAEADDVVEAEAVTEAEGVVEADGALDAEDAVVAPADDAAVADEQIPAEVDEGAAAPELTADSAEPAVATETASATQPPATVTTEAPRRRRWPWIVAIIVVVALLVSGGAFAGATVSYASAYEGRFLPGTRINDVDVSGLTQSEAIVTVRRTLRGHLRRTVAVRYAGRTWEADARALGVRSNLRRVVADVAASQEGVTWREWAGLRWFGEQSSSTGEVKFSYRRAPVAAFVDGIAAAVERKPRDAELNVTGSSIAVTPHQVGRDVKTRQVTRDLMAALRGENKPVPLAVEKIAPEVKSGAFDQVLLLDQSDHRLTLFLNGEDVRSWIVAVGTGDYPTPTGQYEVSLKRYMPTWVNPDPDGWGKDMPEMIPPGENNPLGVRALNWSAPGAIRFHGTQAIDSLGTDASHGCVRMSNDDVSELYELVDEGAVIISQT